MANFTKKAIQTSFLQLLNERPLSQITVKDIVARCGINRNTFYYYFSDIPKLIEETFMEDAQALIDNYPSVDKIDDCLEALIDSALSKKRAVLHIYHSANREIYELYLWKVCDHAINAYINTVSEGQAISEKDLLIIKKYLSSLGFGIISRWLKNDMNDDVRSDFARIMELQKGMVQEMLCRCESRACHPKTDPHRPLPPV